MGKFYVGVTDYEWYRFLKTGLPDDQKDIEIDFWRSAASGKFQALEPGDLFLFKLRNRTGNWRLNGKIVGAAQFKRFEFNTVEEAWEKYHEGNGCMKCSTFQGMIKLINKGKDVELGKEIGCIILSDVVFFDQSDWIDEPDSWKEGTVQGKGFDTLESVEAKRIEATVNKLIQKARQGV